MIKYLVTFLLIARGISAMQHCSVNCDEEEFPDKFPQTEEELKEFCRPVLSILECEYRFLEKCDETRNEQLMFASRVISTVIDICTEGTPIHTAVVDNLKCFDRLANEKPLSHACAVRQESVERTERLTEALIEDGLIALSDNENVTSQTYQCIEIMNFLACGALYIEKDCGTGGMDVYVEVLQRVTPGVILGCEETDKLLPAVISFRRAEEEAERNIAEAFRRRKK